MNLIIPTIEDDNLFENAAYLDFFSKCKILLNTEDAELYRHPIYIELICLKRNIEQRLSEHFWKVHETLRSGKINMAELKQLDKNVSIILLTWEHHLIPLVDKYLDDSSQQHIFKIYNADTPLKIKIWCDVLLKKEYTFEGYTFKNSGPFNLFKEPNNGIIEQDIFKNYEHEANLKLLISEHSTKLDVQDFIELITKYAYPAQKMWPTLIPEHKARLLLNVLWMLTTSYSNIEPSQILQTYLSELTKYEDFNKLITLTKIFDITDKNIMTSILTGENKTIAVDLPELLN